LIISCGVEREGFGHVVVLVRFRGHTRWFLSCDGCTLVTNTLARR
jgi:hypothetical protein